MMRDRSEEVMAASFPNADIAALAEGWTHAFADWPKPDVPKFRAWVYTTWHTDGPLRRVAEFS